MVCTRITPDIGESSYKYTADVNDGDKVAVGFIISLIQSEYYYSIRFEYILKRQRYVAFFLLAFLAVGEGGGWFPVVSISDDCALFCVCCLSFLKENKC